MMTKTRLFEATDAARVLRVSTDTVTRWADAGRLPVAAVSVRGLRLYDPADVVRLARERRQQ